MNENRFTWVRTHKELVDIIQQKRNQQVQLIQVLNKVGISGLHDENDSGERFELKEIDPFSFFCYIYKYGSSRRLKYLQDISEEFKIFKPTDDSGIPSVNAQKVCLFPFESGRKKNEINRLWDIFESAIRNEITDDQFEDVLQINSTGKTKLTEGLFNILPEIFFPINGPTKPYLKEMLGIDPKFNTYTEYLSILKQIKSKVSIPFYELSYEAWKWNNNQSKVNYWVFQGNPKIYNVVGSLSDNMLTTWSVKAHEDKIKVGDKIILWVTGKDQGCYALGEVTSDVYEGLDEEDQIKYYTEQSKNEISKRVKIDITNNLSNNPITKDQIENISELKELKVGNQGTNFSATEEEYFTLLELINSRGSSFEKLISQLNKSDFTNYIEFLRKILHKFNLKQGDDRLVFSIRDNRLNFTIGQRYCWNIYVTDQRGKFGVISKVAINTTSTPFEGDSQQPIYTHFNDISIAKINSDSIFLAIEEELGRTKKSGFRKHNNIEFENFVFKIDPQPINYDSMKLSLNTILYGPPGTGKTFKLNEYKEEYFTDRGITKNSEEVLKEKVSAYPFWKIFAAILSVKNKYCSVTEIMEHPLVQAKVSNTAKTPQNTIWRILQSYADYDSSQMNEKYRGPLQLFNKNQNSEWAIIDSKKAEIVNIVEEELLRIAAHPEQQPVQSTISKARFNFITFHQKYSYEDFIEGIKPLLQDVEVDEAVGQLQFELKKGIFYNSCLEALKLVGYGSFEECQQDKVENRVAKFGEAKGNTSKQFALFIDEINRANISAVFGELITLMEDDKRIGADNEMWVELPYSNEKFSVPSNLYVIGTMNTADRSIALLDIALRRRFEFKALYPEYKESEWWATLLKDINQAIYNWKKNPDFFIGHAFFINKPESDKVKILNTKIIPLLYEYCQNNSDTVKRILTEAKISIKQSGIKENFQIIAE